MADTSMDTMNAWVIAEPSPIETGPLSYERKPIPRPEADELLVRVSVCGVCRTDLHVSEGDLAPHRARITPGHEIVATVVELGAEVSGHAVGDKSGRCVAAPNVRNVPFLPAGRREPLAILALHRVGW